MDSIITNVSGGSTFTTQIDLLYIKYILTHAEYDKEKWKNDPYF